MASTRTPVPLHYAAADALPSAQPGGLLSMPVPQWLWFGLVVAGIFCRVMQYLWDRSYWVDEASLVLNIRTKTAAQLLARLDFHQAAPPLFLLAERGIFHLLGGSELSLRLLPLLAGCAAVVFFATVARRLLAPWAAVLALGLFCFSDRLIWHAVEAKPYGTDVFFSAMLLLVAVGRSQEGTATIRRLILLCATAAVAVWFSYPSVFVFAGLSLAMLPAMVRRGPRGWVVYVLANLIVAISFAALFLIAVRAQHSQSLAEYWADEFIDLRHPLGVPLWLGRHLLSLCNYPTEPAGVLVLPCAIAGVVWMVRAGQFRSLGFLLNPIGISLLAAAAQRYPFDGARLTVYLTPAVLLLAGAGGVALYGWLRRSIGWIALVPAAIMLAISAGSAAVHLVVPQQRGHVRPAVEFVRAHAQKNDGIYALQPHEFECYWPADDPRVREELPAADQIPFGRFWIVWSYPNAHAMHRLDRVLNWARTFATLRQSYVRSGSCAYLFQVSVPAPPHTAAPSILTHHRLMAHDEE